MGIQYSGDKITFPDGTSQGSAIVGFKNRLINALGLINQRGYVSGTATSGANQYTLDRWRVVTSGQNLTFSTSGNVTTFTAPAGGVEQVIEGLNLETGTYVLSWTGTASATVAGVSVSNGGTVSVTGGTNTTVRFSGGTFSLPQFERAMSATSFDYRPYGTELALCQRYFQFNTEHSGGSSSGGNFVSLVVNGFTEMRASPTITLVSGTNAMLDIGVAVRTISSFAIQSASTKGCYGDATPSVTTTGNKTHLVNPNVFSMSAEL